jgi:hypothetical protein
MEQNSIEPTEVTQALYSTSKRLDKGSYVITSKAKEYAQAEKDYRIKLAEEITTLKASGTPVTLIKELAKGNKDVADAKFNRDLAEGTFKASRDMLNALQVEVSALQSILRVQGKIE